MKEGLFAVILSTIYPSSTEDDQKVAYLLVHLCRSRGALPHAIEALGSIEPDALSEAQRIFNSYDWDAAPDEVKMLVAGSASLEITNEAIEEHYDWAMLIANDAIARWSSWFIGPELYRQRGVLKLALKDYAGAVEDLTRAKQMVADISSETGRYAPLQGLDEPLSVAISLSDASPQDLHERVGRASERAAPLFCGKCGHRNPEDARFCPRCGAEIQRPQRVIATPTLATASPRVPIVPGAPADRRTKVAYATGGAIVVLIAVAALAVAIVGQGALSKMALNTTIVGRWEGTDPHGSSYGILPSDFVTRFAPNGAVYLSSGVKSTWAWTGRDYQFTDGQNANPWRGELSWDGKYLTLHDPSNNTFVMHRVP